MKEAIAEQTEEITDILRADSGVDAGYRHGPKQATPGEALQQSSAVLKWYALHRDGRSVPDEITRLARSYLIKNDLEAKGLGFVILHHCEKDFYFLIVNTWRNNNELWETVFYKNGNAMADFAPWPRETTHKHEKESWERFLKSARDETAAQVWLCDLYAVAA